MKKIQQELFVIASLPTVVLILFGLTLSLSHAQQLPHPGLILLFVLLSIATSSFLVYRLRVLLIHPLEETIAGLFHDTHTSISSAGFNELSLAINAYVSHLQREYEHKLLKSDSNYRNLQEKYTALELLNSEILQSSNLLKQETESEKRTADALLRLCYKPLKTIVGFTNLITQNDSQDLSFCIGEITRAARNLQFLIRESQDSPSSPETAEIEPWQFADDVLGTLSPIMSLHKIKVNVIVLRSCPAKLHVEGEQPISLLFQYMLHYFLHLQTNKGDLVLNISFTHGELTFALDEENYPTSVKLSRRFQHLLSKDATLEDGLLYLPVSTVSTVQEKPGDGLTGIVICEGKAQRESLYERLGQLGAHLTNDFKSGNLDFCLVNDEMSQAFKAVHQYLNPDVSIFLLDNNTLYQRENWHHLRNPIDQSELIHLLASLEANHHVEPSYDILAVDDNVANLRLLELQLTELGHSVTTASNGISAVDLCQENHYDLVFLDLQMPGMHGLEATKKILELGTETPPIIGLTAHATNEERQDYLEGGMSQVVIKPIRIDSLKSLLRRHIENIESKPPVAAPRNIADIVFDRGLSLSTANDRPELADELFQLLIATLPEDQAQINLAFRNEDHQALKQAVHKLHGAIRYCGVPRLGSAVAKLERLLKTRLQVDIRGALNIVNSEISSLMIWHRENPDPFGNLGLQQNLGSE
ncbi:MAG: response regulator [Proteobacteria bacterium]|nr:response regulator [Pseudomonadota bacterium]